MKRIEAFFQFGRLETVIEAVEKAGAQGVTVMYARGRGMAERIPRHGMRGTSIHTPLFNIIDGIITIVDDHIVDGVIDAIKKNTHADSKGIIVVSDVSRVVSL